VTRANLQSGGQELNPAVRMFGRTTPGLAANFIGETVGLVRLSYFFHQTGHPKLERAASMLDIGSSAGARQL
jgi:predicted alpha/beta-hydrolase family hydrolase